MPLALTGLIRIEFPTRTVRLCDGGFLQWAAETFTSADDVFGNIAALEPLTEGVGDEVPALELTLQPPGASVPADLSQPGFQRSRARLWIAEYDTATGLLIGTPDLAFDGQVDQTTLSVSRSERSLSMTIVSTAEKLFERNAGNTLSPTFHKSIWPGELGHDNATGLKISTAWGVEAPRRSSGGGRGLRSFVEGGGFGSGVINEAASVAR